MERAVDSIAESNRLLRNISNNINQVAKRANETRSIYAADMIQLQEEVSSLRAQVSDVMWVFSKVRRMTDL